jgi:hypothetical protein
MHPLLIQQLSEDLLSERRRDAARQRLAAGARHGPRRGRGRSVRTLALRLGLLLGGEAVHFRPAPACSHRR